MNEEYVRTCLIYYALDIVRRDIDEVILKDPDRQTKEDLANAGNIIWSAMQRLSKKAKELANEQTRTKRTD